MFLISAVTVVIRRMGLMELFNLIVRAAGGQIIVSLDSSVHSASDSDHIQSRSLGGVLPLV